MFMLLPALVQAQRWHVEGGAGFSNYAGDLQQKNFTLSQAKAEAHVGVRYELSSHLSLRGNLTLAGVGAADKYNAQADLRARNLSFNSRITEGNLLLDYSFLNLSYHAFTPYVFGGIAVFHFNPYTYDSLGAKTYLQPLGTEGQGLAAYPNKQLYSKTSLAIPFGAGVRWRFTDRITLSYELGIRRTFTDYLDDVSGTYADATLLGAARGAEAVQLAYRGDELKSGSPTYPAAGTIRGGASHKDWYYFSGVSISIGLGQLHGFHGTDNGRTDCPKPLDNKF